LPQIDRLAAEMVRTGAPSDVVELIVIDLADEIVRRPHNDRLRGRPAARDR